MSNNVESPDQLNPRDAVVTRLRLSEFFDLVNGFSGDRPECLRLGQWSFILLYDAHPKIADAIRESNDDPFYVDARMPRFLARLASHCEVDA